MAGGRVRRLAIFHRPRALFIGGVLIHPLSIVIGKLFGARGSHIPGNPLASLAAANTFLLIFCLPLASGVYPQRAQWFFPAMLLVIGGRYLTSAQLYGMRLYWALGLSLASGAYLVAASKVPPAYGARWGGTVEAVFAIIVLTLHVRWRREYSAAGA